MRTMSFLPGHRGSAGSLPWPPSSGFLWVPFTHCGCSLAHSYRWHVFTICLPNPTQPYAGSTHVLHVAKSCSNCVNIIGTFLLQKLKLSITPYALNEMSKMLYYERGGMYGDPVISVISSSMHLPENLIFNVIRGRCGKVIGLLFFNTSGQDPCCVSAPKEKGLVLRTFLPSLVFSFAKAAIFWPYLLMQLWEYTICYCTEHLDLVHIF